jgi:hypothetical protein
MTEGFVIDGGASYYCSSECMSKDFTADEVDALDLGGDDSESYWTQWDDEDEDEPCHQCGHAQECINCNPSNYI